MTTRLPRRQSKLQYTNRLIAFLRERGEGLKEDVKVLQQALKDRTEELRIAQERIDTLEASR